LENWVKLLSFKQQMNTRCLRKTWVFPERLEQVSVSFGAVALASGATEPGFIIQYRPVGQPPLGMASEVFTGMEFCSISGSHL
jgi:hypothetical protein